MMKVLGSGRVIWIDLILGRRDILPLESLASMRIWLRRGVSLFV